MFLACTAVNVPIVLALLVGATIYVIFVLNFGRSSSGNVKIFMYFTQTLQIVLSPTSQILPVSSVFNFQFDGGGNACALRRSTSLRSHWRMWCCRLRLLPSWP